MKHYSSSHDEETYEPKGGGDSHTWRWWGTSTLLTPNFDIYQSKCKYKPLLCPTHSYWPPLSAEKICLSLSHLIPEIIWPKVGLFFHKSLSFDTFEAICTTFLLDFRSCWPLFSLLLDIFDSSFFSLNARPPQHWKFGEVFPPPPAYEMITYNCLFSYLIG